MRARSMRISRPRFGTAPVEWHLAIVDPLLPSRVSIRRKATAEVGGNWRSEWPVMVALVILDRQVAAVTAMDDRKFMESTSLWIWSERDAGIQISRNEASAITASRRLPAQRGSLTAVPMRQARSRRRRRSDRRINASVQA
jgi:hypothetical protein